MEIAYPEGMEERVKKKVSEGWIRTWMMVEVLAVTEDAAKSALEKHVDKLEKEKNAFISRKSYHEIKEVENPLPKVAKGYAYVVELEMLFYNFDKLFLVVLHYGPSALEILEPSQIKLDAGEAQSILNSLADTIHQYAALGMGGMVVKT